MCKPIETHFVYFLTPEYLASRGDLEGYNSDPFSTEVRRVTMGRSKLYDLHTNAEIGEHTLAQFQIQSIVPGVKNYITHSQVNIFDQLIIPNISSGFIEQANGGDDPNPYKNLDFSFPEKITCQDWFGRKVVINHLPADPETFGKVSYKIEVYAEDL